MSARQLIRPRRKQRDLPQVTPINADLKWLCQLEGSDCGGRDRRPSWHWRALSILNWMAVFSTQLTFGHQHHPQRKELYTPQRISQRLFVTNPTKLFTHFGSISLNFCG